MTEAERVILDRITSHANGSRFHRKISLYWETIELSANSHRSVERPAILSSSTLASILETHRYYLAHWTGRRPAVLRMKNAAGLAEWRNRKWYGRSTPSIAEVTLQALEVIESMLNLSPEDFENGEAWVSVDDGCSFAVTARGAPPPNASARQLELTSQQFLGLSSATGP